MSLKSFIFLFSLINFFFLSSKLSLSLSLTVFQSSSLSSTTFRARKNVFSSSILPSFPTDIIAYQTGSEFCKYFFLLQFFIVLCMNLRNHHHLQQRFEVFFNCWFTSGLTCDVLNSGSGKLLLCLNMDDFFFDGFVLGCDFWNSSGNLSRWNLDCDFLKVFSFWCFSLWDFSWCFDYDFCLISLLPVPFSSLRYFKIWSKLLKFWFLPFLSVRNFISFLKIFFMFFNPRLFTNLNFSSCFSLLSPLSLFYAFFFQVFEIICWNQIIINVRNVKKLASLLTHSFQIVFYVVKFLNIKMNLDHLGLLKITYDLLW